MLSDSGPDKRVRTEKQHRLDVCQVGRWMYERGQIVACEGNISVRLDAERILTTPTCINKGMMSPDDLAIMDMEGRYLHGDRKISSEAGMHLLFTICVPMCRRVSRASPTATGFAAAGMGAGPSPASGNRGRAWQSAARSLCHSRHTGLKCGARTVYSTLRRFAASRQSRRSYLVVGFVQRFPDGDTRAFRQNHAHAFKLAGEPQLLSTREVAKLMAARARYHVMPPRRRRGTAGNLRQWRKYHGRSDAHALGAGCSGRRSCSQGSRATFKFLPFAKFYPPAFLPLTSTSLCRSLPCPPQPSYSTRSARAILRARNRY